MEVKLRLCRNSQFGLNWKENVKSAKIVRELIQTYQNDIIRRTTEQHSNGPKYEFIVYEFILSREMSYPKRAFISPNRKKKPLL